MNLRILRVVLLTYGFFDFLIGYAGILPITNLAAAQFTTVTGTVTDPSGIPYALGTIQPQLIVPSGAGTPTLGGFAYSPPSGVTGLDSTGSFVMNIGDNNVLLPAGTKWNFLVCSAKGTVQPSGGKGPLCFSLAAPITITGASQSISANLNAVALSLTFTAGGVINANNGTAGAIANYPAAAGSTTVSPSGINYVAPTLSWTTGQGAGTQILGPTDQNFTIASGTARNLVLNATSGIMPIQGNGVTGLAFGAFGITTGQQGNLLFGTSGVPSISSGFGTSPTIAHNDSTTFRVTVGTTPGNSGVVTMGSTAASHWNCPVNNITAAAGNRADNTRQTTDTTTTVTFQNQTTSTGAAVNFTPADVIVVGPCAAM